MNDDNKYQADRERRRVTREQLDDWLVLIVDDQLDNLLVAETALKFHGVKTYRAANGIQALRILEDIQPTLILLDLSMPEMDGWEMFEVLKTRPEMQDIPVIALTAHVMQGDKERVLAAGFTGYISKPFSVAMIVEEIKNILDNS